MLDWGGILTPVGIGTIVEENKQKMNIQGKDYLLEIPLSADIAFIKAYKADKFGNLVFKGCSRNFNIVMSTAADFVIAEVENYVEVGEINPDDVMVPGIFIDAIIEGGK